MATEPESIRQLELNRLRLESAWTVTKPPDGSFATDSPLSPQNIANQPVKTIQQMQLDNAYKAPAYTPSVSAPVEPSNLWAQKLQAEATLNRTYTSSEQEQLKRVAAQESLASKGLKTRDSGINGASNSNPNATSLAGTQSPVPQNSPQSINSQLGVGALIYAGGYIGDAVGDRASEAVFGTSNGFFSSLLGGVGALAGGLLGSALLGGGTLGTGAYAGYFGGSALGNGFGSFLGSALDKLFGGGNPTPNSNKANPSADRGKNYKNPDNVPSPPQGQTAGVGYYVVVNGSTNYADEPYEFLGTVTDFQRGGFLAPIGSVSFRATSNSVFLDVLSTSASDGSVRLDSFLIQSTGGNNRPIDKSGLSYSLQRVDGQSEPSNPAYTDSPNLSGYVPNNPPAPSGAGFDGSPFDALSDGEKYQERTGKREPPVLPDATKPDPTKPRQVAPSSPASSPSPTSPLNGSNPAYDGNKPLASSPSPSNSSSSSAEKQSRPNNGFSSTGMQPAFESKPFVAGTSNPNDYGKEIDNITGKERVTSPVVDPLKAAPVVTPTPKPNAPNAPATDDYATAKVLGAVAVVSGLALYTKNLLDYVNQTTQNTNLNTQPSAQQTNAATGACTALNSATCTTGLKDSIVDPVNANSNANQAANDAKLTGIAANQAVQDGLLAQIISMLTTNFGKILQILNNTVVDRTLAVMNLATNIHNAAMLTRDIGETLGSVVDNVISLSPLRFTNSEGSQVQFTDFIGSNFRSFLISVLGAENYVSLVINWQKANTIYHATMGVINTTQSMLDPISSAVEYGMENVSKIGNSLKEDGVVSENAYPAMDETIRARRVNRFERLNDTLEGAENIASNLSSVTSSAVSIKEDYKQLREDAKDLKDKATAFNTADSEARAALKAELPTEITPITLAPAPAEDEEP